MTGFYAAHCHLPDCESPIDHSTVRQVPAPSQSWRGTKREDGANPSRGRRCNRPGPGTSKGHCSRGKAVPGSPRAVSQKTCLSSPDLTLALPGPEEGVLIRVSRARLAFTLIELLVVIAIIAILIGL